MYVYRHYVRIYINSICAYNFMYVCMGVSVYVYVCMCMYMYVYICVYMYVYGIGKRIWV